VEKERAMWRGKEDGKGKVEKAWEENYEEGKVRRKQAWGKRKRKKADKMGEPRMKGEREAKKQKKEKT